jgi:predicted MFS family arabinose efflux permease
MTNPILKIRNREFEKRDLLLYLLAAMNFSHIVDFMIMMPLGDYLMNSFNIGPGEFSVIVSAYTFSAGISSFFAAFLIDRFDRKTALIFTFTGFSVGTVLVGLANSYILLVAARSLTGVFGGLVAALVLSVVSDLYSYRERGKAMGVVSSAFALASVIGVPIGLYLASQFSWHAPFFMVGGLASIFTVVTAFVFPKMKGHISSLPKPKPLKVIKNVISDRNQVYALLMGMTIILGQFLLVPFLTPYMMRNVGFSEETVTLIYLFGGGAVVFSAPLVGRLTDRIGPLKVFTIFLLSSFVLVLTITNLPKVPIYIALILTTIFFMMVNGRMIPANTMITAAVSPETRGSFMSFKSSIQQLSAALASLVSGAIMVIGDDGLFHNYNWVGVLSICVSATSFLLAPRLRVAKGNE